MELPESIVERLTKRKPLPPFPVPFLDPGEFGSGFRRLAHKGCVACRKADKSGKTIFCATCEVSVMQNAPAIVEIAEENETFKSGRLFDLSDSPFALLKIGQQWPSSSSVRGDTPPRVRKSEPSTRSWQRNRTWTSTTLTGTSSLPYP